MNIAFVDIAGVLETTHSPNHQTLDQEAVRHLLAFTEKYNMRIVLTSNSRIGRTLQQLNELYQIPIFDKTPVIPYADRGDEIQEWIDDAPLKHGQKVKRFVIFDDDADMGPLNPYLAQCQYQNGIDARTLQYAECIVEEGHYENFC